MTQRRQDDCDAFTEIVAEKYFSTTTKAIKAVDKNHMVLGYRSVAVTLRSRDLLGGWFTSKDPLHGGVRGS